ncbi:hypothetical protein DL98DRAFT_540388 [Cadophora sp. DSE1049]|nr:hypothetical protein DL98DRAFT_540388 [Cadophora sp. DSE1049]
MAPRQAKRNIPKVGRQLSVPKDQGKRPQGIEKGRPQLPSLSTDSICPLCKIRIENENERKNLMNHSFARQPNPIQSDHEHLLHTWTRGDIVGQAAADGIAGHKTNPIDYWIKKQRWPETYSEQDYQTRRDFEKDSWLEKYWEPEDNMNHGYIGL